MRKPVDTTGPSATLRPRHLEFRRMRSEDLDAVMEIERVAFRHPWSTELFRRELTHSWSTILLAVDPNNSRILGFVIFWLVHDEIHVLNVAVAPAERRRGIGRALLLDTIERGRKLGAKVMTLEVRRSNDAAINLYRSLDFRPVGVRPNYYVDEGEDAIVMVLDF